MKNLRIKQQRVSNESTWNKKWQSLGHTEGK